MKRYHLLYVEVMWVINIVYIAMMIAGCYLDMFIVDDFFVGVLIFQALLLGYFIFHLKTHLLSDN